MTRGRESAAVYEIRFYKGGAKSPSATWRVVTDENGKANLSDEYLDKTFENSGFYKSTSGNICLPLGAVTIQEIKAPEGYLLNSEMCTCEITAGTDAAETVSTFN